MASPQRVEISTVSYLKFVGVLLGVAFLWFIRDILALLFIVLIIVAALGPTVRTMEKNGVPRVLGVSLIYIAAFLVLAGIFSMIVPPLINQIRALAQNFPSLVSQVAPLYEILIESNAVDALNKLSNQLGSVTQSVFTATSNIFGGAFAAITVLVISFYMLVDARQNRDSLVVLVPARYLKQVTDIVSRAGDKLGSWLRGQLILSVVITIITLIGLLLLGVPFALTLAVLAGLLEIVPFIGPIIAGIVAVAVAYMAGSWQLALAVFVFYILLQQLENHFLVPKIMSNAVGLSPVVVIIALAVGSKLAGVVGAILAVPLVATLSVIAHELPQFRRRSS